MYFCHINILPVVGSIPSCPGPGVCYLTCLTDKNWHIQHLIEPTNYSGHRTGKGQFSFQSQRKAMPKNAQTTTQLHSSHTLLKKCSKFSKPGFSNTWTMNFQMFKLVLEKAEEPEIKLPTYAGSLKQQESSKKHLFLLYWLCQSLWLCGSH